MEGPGSFEDMELKDGELSRLQGKMQLKCFLLILNIIHQSGGGYISNILQELPRQRWFLVLLLTGLA